MIILIKVFFFPAFFYSGDVAFSFQIHKTADKLSYLLHIPEEKALLLSLEVIVTSSLFIAHNGCVEGQEC